MKANKDVVLTPPSSSISKGERRKNVRAYLGCTACLLAVAIMGGYVLDKTYHFYWRLVKTGEKLGVRTSPKPIAPLPPSRPGIDHLYVEGMEHLKASDWKQALASFQAAAEQGHARAAYQAGLLLMEGPREMRDYAGSATSLVQSLRAVEGDLPEAAWKLGWLYEQGLGVVKDHDFARQLRDFALSLPEGGLDQESREFLSRLWEEGKTGRVDLAKAAIWAEISGDHARYLLLLGRASAVGDSKGAVLLASNYLNPIGSGMSPEPDKAWETLQRAADRGSCAAWLKLSGLCAMGRGGPKDPERALQCLHKAAEGPEPQAEAWYRLGVHILGSQSPLPENLKAEQCFNRAIELSNIPNLTEVPSLPQTRQDFQGDQSPQDPEGSPKTARKFARKTSRSRKGFDARDPESLADMVYGGPLGQIPMARVRQDAHAGLARCYEGGIGVTKNQLMAGKHYLQAHLYPEANTALLKALEQGEDEAAVLLGDLYLEQGDSHSAATSYREGIRRGRLEAEWKLGRLLSGLDRLPANTKPLPIDVAAGLGLLEKAAQKGTPEAVLGFAEAAASVKLDQPEFWQSKAGVYLGQMAQSGQREILLAWITWLLDEGSSGSIKKAIKAADMLVSQTGPSLLSSPFSQSLPALARRLSGEAGDPYDFARAKSYYRYAAAWDMSEAWAGLANMYWGGYGVLGDPVRAMYCQCRAVRAESRDRDNDDGGC